MLRPVCGRTAVLVALAWLAAGTACGARSDIDESGRAETPPPTPRPMAPLSTSRVTSHRPTAATIDVCLDRACSDRAIPSVTVAGTQYTPAADLPPGMLYWRLHSAADPTATSPVWQFLVGARSAPVDTSWGTTLDVNGDGFADVVVGTTTGAYLVMGSAAGLSTVPAAQFSRMGSAVPLGAAAVASAGDVNGDGYADLVIGNPAFGSDPSLPSVAYIYFGGPNGVRATPDMVLSDPTGNDALFGSSVLGAGDVDRDGYADVIVGNESTYYLFSGGPTGPGPIPSRLCDGRRIAVGDFNGDGYADRVCENVAFLGGPDGGTSTTLPVTVYAVSLAGDVNGDGYADIVVGSAGNRLDGNVSIYMGGPKGLDPTPTASLEGSDDEGLGACVASAGDVNGDGYGDVVVCPGNVVISSSVFLYFGSSEGLVTTAPLLLTQTVQPTDGAMVAAAGGDTNGDGYADVILGTLEQDVDVFEGRAGGPSSAPSVILTGPGQFGDTLFGASY